MTAWWQRLRDVTTTVAATVADLFYDGSNGHVLCAFTDGILHQYENNITCNRPRQGRYVQIQLGHTDYLNIYEVDVYGV